MPAAGSLGSGRHAEVRLHLGKEAAAEPRESASTSRGSLLTLHREEAAAAEEEEAAPGRPPPRARRSPSGRSRPRRTRLLRSAKPRSGRAALGSAAQPAPRRRPQQQEQQQRAGCNPGWGPGTPARRRRSSRGYGQLRAGFPSAPGDPRGPPEQARGRRALTRSGPTLPSSPHLHASRSTLAAQLLPLPLPPLADARAAAAAALAGRGHVTRPAGSLRAGGRARAHERRYRRSDRDWRFPERAFKGRIRRARPRPASARPGLGWLCVCVVGGPELEARGVERVAWSAGRVTRASARPSLSSFPARRAPGCPRPLLRFPRPPSPPAAASDWPSGSDVCVSMTCRAGEGRGRGAAGEEGAATPSVTAWCLGARPGGSGNVRKQESDDCLRQQWDALHLGSRSSRPPRGRRRSPVTGR